MPRSFFRTVLRPVLTALVAASCLVGAPALAKSRIKDIVAFEGVRENQLIGYGIVVGLNGTGDSLRNAPMTKQSLEAMLERQGVNVRDANLNTKNVAAVMVTATLPPFARQGSRIDVAVSALGDSKSLLGGTLLVTPLLGADGEAYAVAQGALSVGGFQAKGDAEIIAWLNRLEEQHETVLLVCGGEVEAGSLVTEEYLMALERKHFCALLENPKSQERIMGMLQTGKPVRN